MCYEDVSIHRHGPKKGGIARASSSLLQRCVMRPTRQLNFRRVLVQVCRQ